MPPSESPLGRWNALRCAAGTRRGQRSALTLPDWALTRRRSCFARCVAFGPRRRQARLRSESVDMPWFNPNNRKQKLDELVQMLVRKNSEAVFTIPELAEILGVGNRTVLRCAEELGVTELLAVRG